MEDVKLSDIKSITQETKQGMQALQLEEMGVESKSPHNLQHFKSLLEIFSIKSSIIIPIEAW